VWKSARALIDLHSSDQIIMQPPQVIILGCLKDYTTIDQLSRAAMAVQ